MVHGSYRIQKHVTVLIPGNDIHECVCVSFFVCMRRG